MPPTRAAYARAPNGWPFAEQVDRAHEPGERRRSGFDLREVPLSKPVGEAKGARASLPNSALTRFETASRVAILGQGPREEGIEQTGVLRRWKPPAFLRSPGREERGRFLVASSLDQHMAEIAAAEDPARVVGTHIDGLTQLKLGVC